MNQLDSKVKIIVAAIIVLILTLVTLFGVANTNFGYSIVLSLCGFFMVIDALYKKFIKKKSESDYRFFFFEYLIGGILAMGLGFYYFFSSI